MESKYLSNFLFNSSLSLGGIIFQSPLWLLAIPLAALPWVQDRRGRRFHPLAHLRLMGGSTVASRRTLLNHLGWLLRCCAIILTIVALSRPQMGVLPTARSNEGIDIMLAIDTSGSMRARDFEIGGQRPDRLEVIKSVISEFISARPDDRIGMVVFGSGAYTQAPLTLDHDILTQFLDKIEIGVVGDGTAIGDGLGAAVKRLKGTPGKSRVIVLLTDGANNSGRIDPLAAATAAKAFGIRVHTIGVGSEGVVPIVQNGRVFHIKADVDEKTLRSISDATGGKYYRATDAGALQGVYKDIDQLEKVRHKQHQKRRGRDIYWQIIACALALLLLEALWRLTPYRRLPA
jgi:Ca-activated chloride channel family protein